ncbi:MAG: ABC transporter permease, partial [Rhodanobacteraceae bacterium]
MSTFAAAFVFEWRKTKRSSALWLVVVGAFFTPAIVAVARLLAPAKLPELYATADFWPSLWKSSWESMAIFLLPMAAILATSLVVHIEYRNNAWKQVQTLPLGRATLFFAKLAVALVLIALFLVLFDVAICVGALVPWLVLERVPFPAAEFPFATFARQTALYFLDSVPIIAATYLLALRSQSFLVPIGVGFLAWVAALAALSSSFGVWMPYAYTLLSYLQLYPSARGVPVSHEVHSLAVAYAVLFTGLAKAT